MKLQIQETNTREVEIQLPYYAKDICHQFYVFSDKKCICVTHGNVDEGIQIMHSEAPFNLKAEPSTKEEFEAALQETIEKLTNIQIPQQA